MIKQTKSSKSFSGLFALPTSTKAHIHEPTRGNAFVPNVYMYLLLATTDSEGKVGYPAAVVMQSSEPLLNADGGEFEVGDEIATQHAEVRKPLPLRMVAAVRLPDGTIEGDASQAAKGISLPHWEFIPANEDGSANQGAINSVKDRIELVKAEKEEAKQNVRDAKASKKSTAPVAKSA